MAFSSAREGKINQNILFVAATGVVSAAAVAATSWWWYHHRHGRERQPLPTTNVPLSTMSKAFTNLSVYESLIGNTPCVLLPNLSKQLRCSVYVKLENYNPGGTGKDRAAQAILKEWSRAAQKSAQNQHEEKSVASYTKPTNGIANTSMNNSNPIKIYDSLIDQALQNSNKNNVNSNTASLIVEGTSGSTGISLATLATLHGHACLVVLPDDQATEKVQLLQTLGAVIYVVPCAAIASARHYVKIAQAVARQAQDRGIHVIFANQFENLDNMRVHYETTGPEIYRQCRPDVFVMSAGTGGTIAGVARYLKEQNPQTEIVLVDPPGSVLYEKVEHGVAFSREQREVALLRHRYDSIAEGIGLDRITQNLEEGLPYIDRATQVSDQEAIDMAHWILRHEGLLLGSSSAMNLVGACRVARTYVNCNKRICTIICDTGQRHLTRFWNEDFIKNGRGLQWPGDAVAERIPDCLR